MNPIQLTELPEKWSAQIKNGLLRSHLQRSADYQLSQLPLIFGILIIVIFVDRLIQWLQGLRQSGREKLDKPPLNSHQVEQHSYNPDSVHILSALPQSLVRFAPQLSYERRLALDRSSQKGIVCSPLFYFLSRNCPDPQSLSPVSCTGLLADESSPCIFSHSFQHVAAEIFSGCVYSCLSCSLCRSNQRETTRARRFAAT